MFVNMWPQKFPHRDYLHIPSNAEVKAIPFRSLPLHIVQKFHQMDSYIDSNNAPHVIFVSPVTKSTMHRNHKLSTFTKESTKQMFSEGNHFAPTPKKIMTGHADDAEDCFVPIRSSKAIASTILQLSQMGKDKTTVSHNENVTGKTENTQRVVDIKVRALYKYKNTMYLLPAQKATGEPYQKDLNGIMDTLPSTIGVTKDKCDTMSRNDLLKNKMPNITRPHHTQRKVTEQTHNEIQFSKTPALNPSQGRSLQENQLPLVMRQIKRKMDFEDVKSVKKRPNPGGSNTNHKRTETETPTFSIMEPEASLEVSPGVLEEFPGFSCSPIQTSASKKKAEKAAMSPSNPLLYIEPQISPPTDIYKECTDSRSSSPFSAVTISTDTSEGFESDQDEGWFIKSQPPNIKERPGQPSFVRHQDETTQDETIQRLQKHMRECYEVVQNILAKK
ncbi:uncharacterized protein [Pyxicephalus adspersus]|uniref:uncharacterized protein n=1 Tax=Pyxicephalus adspersus TaxID=30357 RepID=UPI003B5A9145